ncbi:unnamed protein product [Caretta caretta]
MNTGAMVQRSRQEARATQLDTGATGRQRQLGGRATQTDTRAIGRHSRQGATATLNQSARPQAAADFREGGSWGRAVELELELEMP